MSEYLEYDPSVIDKRQVYRLLTGAVRRARLSSDCQTG